jgi:alkanesulfonate monooxygenase SsuD/methylene tetrahydromethanopterin reductase-like flavin-dependent oxidoreductase (luciferase family)
MQFSLVFEAQLANPSAENERQTLNHCVEQAVEAERVGFDRIWAVEHHSLRWYAHMSAPEVFLSFVAAKTSRIRLGHGVVCMPFSYNHPVRVGERAAMLDVLSGGRLDLGAGRGGTEQETSLFGIDRAVTGAQVEEALRMISSMWREDSFAWNGDELHFAAHPIVPRPIQLPHPPLFLACSHRETLEKAAALGVGALVFGFGGPPEIAEFRELYDKARSMRDVSRCVSDRITDHLAALCPAIVLEDAAEARRIGVRGQRFFSEAIDHWYQGRPEPIEGTDHDDDERALAIAHEGLRDRLERMHVQYTPSHGMVYRPSPAFGDAASASRYVGELGDAGADEVMFMVQMGTVPHEVCMETIRRLGEEVIPQFRSAGAVAS